MKYIVLLLLLIPLAQATEERAVICIPCHNNIGVDVYKDDNECGDCHNYLTVDRNLNIPLFEEQHNPNICSACHPIKDANSYHQTHGNVSCQTCHGTEIAKPDVIITNCGGCHGGKIHDIHQGNIDRICSNCHGSHPGSNPVSESASLNKDISATVYAKVVNYKQFTLYEVIKRILSSLSI